MSKEEKSDRKNRSFQFEQNMDLDEEATRELIDIQLRGAGWEADSKSLTYANGIRPEKGKNLAIAEWKIG